MQLIRPVCIDLKVGFTWPSSKSMEREPPHRGRGKPRRLSHHSDVYHLNASLRPSAHRQPSIRFQHLVVDQHRNSKLQQPSGMMCLPFHVNCLCKYRHNLYISVETINAQMCGQGENLLYELLVQRDARQTSA